MRTLALPRKVEQWSLTTLREKLIKIGAKVVSVKKNLSDVTLAFRLGTGKPVKAGSVDGAAGPPRSRYPGSGNGKG